MAETVTHPRDVKIGDDLILIDNAEEVECIVTSDPDEVEDLGGDDKGWWQCNIKRKKDGAKWYATWDEENGWCVGGD